MKRTFVILAILLSITAEAQFDTLAVHQQIRGSVDSMITAFRNGNWHTMASYTNEKLVGFMGGTEAYARLVDSTLGRIMKDGSLDEYQAGKILQVVKTPGGYQCIVESFLQMTMNGTTVTGCSYNLGTSPNGTDWRFLRLEEDSPYDIKDFVPDLSPQLKLPSDQMALGVTLEEFKKTYKVQYRATKKPVKKTTPVKKKPKPKPKKQ